MRTGPLLAAVTLVLLATGCGPSSDRSGYADVDARFLADTVVVVAASRSDTTPLGMKGSTLFVDRSGSVTRVDNEGMDGVELAEEDGVIGFSDVKRDYLLGTDDPVRERRDVPSPMHGSFLLDGRLVSVLNGGFGDDGYELTIAESGKTSTVRDETGYASAVAKCDDGVWVSIDPEVEDTRLTGTEVYRRVAPASRREWTVDVAPRRLEMSEAACRGSRLVGWGTVSQRGRADNDVLVDLDVRTGRSATVPLRPSRTQRTAGSDVHLEAFTVIDESVYAVESRRRDGRTSYGLLRVDASKGDVTEVADLGQQAEIDTLFRFDDGALYVLDVTRDTDSRLRAFSVSDGRVKGAREFDALDRKLNGRFTTFDGQRFPMDFAVLAGVDRW